jgi:hypothetical protein
MRHEHCGGRAAKAELVTGTEAASSGPVRRNQTHMPRGDLPLRTLDPLHFVAALALDAQEPRGKGGEWFAQRQRPPGGTHAAVS